MVFWLLAWVDVMFAWIKKLFKKDEEEVLPDLLYLIKKWEGCKLTAYPDPATGGEPFTIGWGTTFYPDGSRVKKGDKITQQQADNILQWYCVENIKLPKGQFTVNQKIALYSLIYNIGQGAFDRSTCKKNIEAQEWKRAHANWTWTKAGGKELKGLVRRRNDEKTLFFEGLI